MSDITDVLGIKVDIQDTISDKDILDKYIPDMFIDSKKEIKINENVFAKAFRDINHLQFSNGVYYTRGGKVTEELLARDVWKTLDSMNFNQNVDATTRKLLGTIKYASTVDKLVVHPNIVPFVNGDLDIDNMTFYGNRFNPTPYRLPVSLQLDFKRIPTFQKWINDLLYEDDQNTLQEFLGYCLIPTTKAQKSLFLVGEGGAGKSVLGVILQEMIGGAMISTPNTQDFIQDKFKLPELENKLVLYDDDLDNSALQGTGLYKKLITNQLSLTADRKFGQPFSFTPYAKLVSCCNEMLTSMYDNTDGFYRRLLPILIKPKRKDFVPDLQFYEKIKNEIEGITQWALIGLIRLINNNYVITESNRSVNYLNQKKTIGNHFPLFFEQCFEYGDRLLTSTKDIISTYNYWCSDNSFTPRKERAIQSFLSDNSEQLKIKPTNKIKTSDGKLVRGYIGLGLKKEYCRLYIKV